MTSIRRFGFRTFNLLSVLALVSFAVIDLNVGMATPVFYDALFGDFNANHTPSFLFLIGFSFTCFFIIPALVAKVIFREKLSNLGMRMPQGKAKTVLLVILALAVLTPSIYLLSKLPDFKSYYS